MKIKRIFPWLVFAVFLPLLLPAILGMAAELNILAQNGVTTRVSVDTNGTEGNAASWSPAISNNGQYVIFVSGASNLVNDTNGVADTFTHNLQTGETTRVSISSNGGQGNGLSQGYPAPSANGQYVAFSSNANNLVSEDMNDAWDVFVHDLLTGETSRISVASDGAEGNASSSSTSLSKDGRYVAFFSQANNLVSEDTNNVQDVFVHDIQTEQTTRVSIASDGTEGNYASWGPSLSANGRYVGFTSEANNLVSGDTNDVWDVFVHDLQTGQTQRISVASDGTEGNREAQGVSLSADGHYVAFASLADNLVSGDTNGVWDVFVHDLHTGQTRRVSVASDGTEQNASSSSFSLSANGRYVAFTSLADNLVSGDTNGSWDVFVYDLQTGQTKRISVASDGTEGNADSAYYFSVPSISANGRYVAYISFASNLVDGDTNETMDIFVFDNGIPNLTLPLVTKP